ncbi:MAG: TerB N-terminal domain-containing protein [Vampirovibrio sp.]|nr:TerB N-terminal domain-containing protein [Vampirovibrio sp.]
MNLLKLFLKIIETKNVVELATEKNVVNSTPLKVKLDTIPNEIMELLWFADGEFENYNTDLTNSSKVKISDYTIEISLSSTVEPSVISFNNVIKEPSLDTFIENLGYYPAYHSITPEQRWVYLNWLRHIDSPIHIGYIFLFYYGLERHLFFGDYESAFNMVLRLRKHHKNTSFLSYSSDALIACSIINNRVDFLLQFIENTPIEEVIISDLYLLAKRSLNIALTALELMSLAKKVNFNNERYIKNESEFFEVELTQLIFEKFNCDGIPIKQFIIDSSVLTEEIIAANYSLKSRTVQIPSLINSFEFTGIARELLQKTHDNLKVKLRSIRSRNSIVLVKVKKNEATKEPSNIFKKSILFDEIDVHQFDQNVRFYNQSICPYCLQGTSKITSSKGICSACGELIFVKRNEFKGEKILLTETDSFKMHQLQKERAERNWIYRLLKNNNITEKELADQVKKKNKTVRECLIELISKLADEHFNLKDYGLYRNSLMQIGIIYEKSNNPSEALNYYLIVCWLDLNGAGNSGTGFDEDFAFIAPAIITSISKLCNQLSLNKTDLEKLFSQYSSDKTITGMPLTPNIAWAKLSTEIYKL